MTAPPGGARMGPSSRSGGPDDPPPGPPAGRIAAGRRCFSMDVVRVPDAGGTPAAVLLMAAAPQVGPTALREVEAALERYLAEVRAVGPVPPTEAAFLHHARTFVQWLRGES